MATGSMYPEPWVAKDPKTASSSASYCVPRHDNAASTKLPSPCLCCGGASQAAKGAAGGLSEKPLPFLLPPAWPSVIVLPYARARVCDDNAAGRSPP